MAKKRPFSCGTDMGNPERPRWAHFASSGSQSEHRIRFFMPTCGFNHIMRQCGIVNQLLHSNKEAYYSTFIQDNSNEVSFKTVNMPLHRNSEACLDFLKVVRLVFWSGVVGPARSLARAMRSKARLVSKSKACYPQASNDAELANAFADFFLCRRLNASAEKSRVVVRPME